MKTEKEIQRAHDLLVGITLEDIPMLKVGGESMPPEKMKVIKSYLSISASALCWCLEHTAPGCAGNQFEQRLKELEEAAESLGYSLSKIQDN